MKHLFYAALLLLSLSACRNSLEERAAQECKEYTEKKCPTPVVNDTRMDSMVLKHLLALSIITIHLLVKLITSRLSTLREQSSERPYVMR